MSEVIWATGKPKEVTLTNEIYWASKPPEVRKLRGLINEDCISEAVRLADLGFTIDVPIDVWHWGADMTMYNRASLGFTWVPSAKQDPIAIGPGITGIIGKPYDPLNPPPGSIKVSIKAEDYPAFDPPVVTPAPDEPKFVGKHLYGKTFAYGPASVSNGKFTVSHGQLVPQGTKTYKAVFVFGLFGPGLEYQEQ